tara:strand:+ start:1980 stop:2867 length:888 start_codon:yes stop_codon:yes gene_type:complete
MLINRRQALVGITGITGSLILTNCGINDSNYRSTVTRAQNFSLGPRFPDGFSAPTVLVAETLQRAPYALIDNDGWPVTDKAPKIIDLTVQHIESKEIIFSGEVNRHGEPGVTPYYPVVFTPPMEGKYQISGPDIFENRQFQVAKKNSRSIIQVGDSMPSIATPTFSDNQGITPICTRSNKICPLHEVTVTEALSRPGPIALLISTPRFCQQDVCGPSLEVLIEHSKNLDSDWSVIHAEVYVNPINNDFALTPVVETYKLNFEPSLIVANQTGIVTSSLNFAMDSLEVAEALRSGN